MPSARILSHAFLLVAPHILGVASIAAEPPLLREDFEEAELGSFPAGWSDLADIPGEQQTVLTRVREIAGMDGGRTRALEIRSLHGTSQGIFRPIAPRPVYRVELSLRVETAAQTTGGNHPVDIGFASFDPLSRFWDWSGSSVYSGGAGNLWANYTGPTPTEDDWLSRATRLGLGVWYRIEYTADTVSGRSTTVIRHAASGNELARTTLRRASLIGRVFDTLHVATHQLGNASGQARILVDDIVFADSGEAPAPQARFVHELFEDCELPAEVFLDATTSSSPEASPITMYEWEVRLRDEVVERVEAADADAIDIELVEAGSYTVTLEVTNGAGLCSAVSRSIEILPACDEPNDGWVSEDFEMDAVDEFPAAWDDLMDVPRERPGTVTRVVDGIDASGSPSRMLEISSRMGMSQGIYRSIAPRSVHTIHVDVRIEQDMPRHDNNLAIDVGFATFVSSVSPFEWSVSSLFGGGGSGLAWWAYGYLAKSNEVADRLSQAPRILVGVWYRLTYRIDSETGLSSSRVVDLTTEEEVAHAVYLHPFQRGRTFDVVSIASHQRGAAGTPSRVHIDNIFYEDAARSAFVRAEINGDGAVDLSDAIFVLDWLFAGGPEPACLAAADVNGSGDVDISDPTYLLAHLFLGGPPPVAPYPLCGSAELQSDEKLGCELTCE